MAASRRDVEVDGNDLIINGKRVKGLQIADPTKLGWGDLGIDIAMECSGRFTKRADAEKHLQAGAKKVLISAPATDEDITVVYGVNDKELKASHTVVSNASCTTNCLAPVAYVLHNAIGIEHGFMTTIHSYTGDQRTVDTMHSDLHRARAAALNIIPTSTGAAEAVGKVLPDLKGKLDGTSLRVPTPNVSVIDFKFVAKARDDGGRSQCRDQGRRRRAAERHSRHLYRSAGFDGFQPRPAFFDLRARRDQGHRRHLCARDELVRQRVGLLQPHAGYGGCDDEGEVSVANRPRQKFLTRNNGYGLLERSANPDVQRNYGLHSHRDQARP